MVTYMNTLIEQGLGVDSRTVRVCLATCDAVWYSATHQQRNATRHEFDGQSLEAAGGSISARHRLLPPEQAAPHYFAVQPSQTRSSHN